MCIQLTSIFYNEFMSNVNRNLGQPFLRSEGKTEIIKKIEKIFNNYVKQIEGISEKQALIKLGKEYLKDYLKEYYMLEVVEKFKKVLKENLNKKGVSQENLHEESKEIKFKKEILEKYESETLPEDLQKYKEEVLKGFLKEDKERVEEYLQEYKEGVLEELSAEILF